MYRPSRQFPHLYYYIMFFLHDSVPSHFMWIMMNLKSLSFIIILIHMKFTTNLIYSGILNFYVLLISIISTLETFTPEFKYVDLKM